MGVIGLLLSLFLAWIIIGFICYTIQNKKWGKMEKIGLILILVLFFLFPIIFGIGVNSLHFLGIDMQFVPHWVRGLANSLLEGERR